MHSAASAFKHTLAERPQGLTDQMPWLLSSNRGLSQIAIVYLSTQQATSAWHESPVA